MSVYETDTLVIGAGSIGIAVAYYLKKHDPSLSVTLVDCGQPMAFTSAQSGENYRNWWPNPMMRSFTDRSIDLMEEIALESDNFLQMTRRGYVLATRETNIDDHLAELATGYEGSPEKQVRMHTRNGGSDYQLAMVEDWQRAPGGVDVLTDTKLIRDAFPYFDEEIRSVIHIRRAGMISGQQMGQYMLQAFRAAGGKRMTGKVGHIENAGMFSAQLDGGATTIHAARIVNAAGPFVGEIAAMLDMELPIENWIQQKIAFEDTKRAIDRTMPFAIDLDPQRLDWDKDERQMLAEDPDFAWLAELLPGAVHCRPEGGDKGSWVKLGWAYNSVSAPVSFEPTFDDQFPEIVLRGAARLNPSLTAYYGQLPRNMVHYGGYYTLTKENWPLLGPTEVDGFYLAGALSGFGSMAACASGDLLARHVLGKSLPDYAPLLSPRRYGNPDIVAIMDAQQSRGIL